MNNLLDPAILFFLIGVVAGAVKSNLEIPPAIARFLSLYLLMALGLKGGFALAHSGFSAEVGASLGAAMALAVAVPLVGYLLLRKVVSGFDAAAIAATYGSVSAVTFVTTVQFLEGQSVAYGGHMAAAMALMESPAIVMAVLLANTLRQRAAMDVTGGGAGVLRWGGAQAGSGLSMGKVLHESLTDGAQVLLLGAMVVGFVSGDAGKVAMQPFSGDLFKGMLAFFLLDMGMSAARNGPAIRKASPWLMAYAVLGPLIHASAALALASLLQLSPGNGALLMVLAASASYIAVPAALRFAIPEAQPSLYVGMSLGLTFPLNIVLGIPLYTYCAQMVLG